MLENGQLCFVDVPTTTISLKAIVYSGSESKLDCFISSCPPPEGMEWHESIDGETFCRIDTSQPKYNGSSVNPYQPYLLIPKTTLNDEQFYRALVWNKIGRSMTETVYLKGNAPSRIKRLKRSMKTIYTFIFNN